MLSLGEPKPYPLMSWSKRYESQAEFSADIAADSGQVIEAGHQINQARQIVNEILASGVIGDIDPESEHKKEFRISLAGHATADHNPREGETKDWLRIEISQK